MTWVLWLVVVAFSGPAQQQPLTADAPTTQRSCEQLRASIWPDVRAMFPDVQANVKELRLECRQNEVVR